MDEQQETSLATTGQARLVGRLSTAFYAAAATAAVIGQTWVAVDHLPWPDTLAPVWRVLVSGAGAATLELLAVVLAVMADYRMRLGERAVAVRVFSAAVAIVATGVIVIGHHHDLYLAAAFGTLSAAAYLLALVHMAARRRDALRAAGLLAQVPPSFGLYRWLRHPVLTARAAELARVQGLGLREALRQAELELRAERRRPAIAAAVEAAIRSSHDDPRMAEIAVSTLDLDRIAAELETQADYAGWAKRLAPAVTAPAPDTAPAMSAPESGHGTGHEADTGADTAPDMERTSAGHDRADITTQQADMSAPGRRTPPGRGRSKKAGRDAKAAGTVTADHLRDLLDQHPDMTQRQLAQLVGLSDRQVRRILKSQPGPQADMSAPEAGHVRVNGRAMSG